MSRSRVWTATVLMYALWATMCMTGCGVSTAIPPEPSSGSAQSLPADSSISSSLPEGVYSGTVDCEITTIDALGRVSTQTIPQAVTYEISDRGIPIIQGQEIRVGRTVTIGGLSGTYTRIQPTRNGIVVHSDSTIRVGGSSASGIGIWELRTTTTDALEVRLTYEAVDDTGGVVNEACTGVLSP